MAKKLEVTANVAILVLACLIGWVVVREHRLKTSGLKMNGQLALATGDSMKLPDTDWARNGRTLLLVLQDGCKFCSESAPFYRKLAGLAAKAGVQLVAVLPQSRDDGARYLRRIGVAIAEVRQAPLHDMKVRGTPTLLLIGRSGAVEKIWVGRLSVEREADVLKSVVGSVD